MFNKKLAANSKRSLWFLFKSKIFFGSKIKEKPGTFLSSFLKSFFDGLSFVN